MIFLFLPINDPITLAGIIRAVNNIEIPVLSPDVGNGSADKISTIHALIAPDISPESIPSPEILTAPMPHNIELRYKAQIDSGAITDSGLSIVFAIPQNISRNVIPDTTNTP